MSGHAKLSPSSSKRWGGANGCPASVARSVGIHSPSNEASRKGTAKHMVSAICLETGVEPASFLGRLVVFVSEVDAPEKERECFAEDVNLDAVILKAEFPINDEFVSHCEMYVNYVRQNVAMSGGKLFVEQRLSIEHITSEVGAKGTTDALVICDKTLTVIDAKFGVGRVNAFESVKLPNGTTWVEPNSQLAMYADAALVEHALFFDFEFVTLIIVQPALNHVSDCTMLVAEFKEYIETLRVAAEATRQANAEYNPSSENCFFCPARMVCEARRDWALETVIGGFDDLTLAPVRVVKDIELGDIYNKLGAIREWCNDVETRVKDALEDGQVVKRSDGLRYKLVSGKLGNRAWSSEAAATELLRDMRLRDEQIFNMSVISPTQAEKLSKPVGTEKPAIGPIRWNRLKALITRADGRPTVALETDSRPELQPADSLFDELPIESEVAVSTEQVVSDLFS